MPNSAPARTTADAESRVSRANAVLAGTIVLLCVGASFVVPFLVADPWLRLALALLPALLANLHWGLIHEAIHGHLLEDSRSSERLGRWLAVAFGAPLAPLRFAHLRHHRYNRTPLSRDDVYDPALTPAWKAQLGYYAYIGGGLYLAELLLAPIAFLPRSILERLVRASTPRGTDHPPALDDLARHVLTGRRELMRYRIDAVWVLSWLALAIYCWREQPSALLAMIGVRALLVSMMDNAAHYGTPLDQRRHALNLRAPRLASALLLNFNFHRQHHQQPNLPWHRLPDEADRMPADPSLLTAVLRQLRGAKTVAALAEESEQP